MSSLISAIRDKVVRADQVINPPILLLEENASSKCKPIVINTGELHWALKIKSDQQSRILNCSQGFCKLPDYLIFVETQAKRRTEIRIFSCELKSSRTGADNGVSQVQMGRFVAEYLIRLGRFALGQPAEPRGEEVILFYGAIFCPDPRPPSPMPITKVGPIKYSQILDNLSSMLIFQLADGISVDLRDLCF